MKRITLLLAAFFCAIVLGYSQSLEDLGDEAFINGNYAQATEYYKQANSLQPSGALKEKINKSKSLKTEFEIINNAIAANEFEKAKLHIDNVLTIDPGNLWANEKKNQLGDKKTKERFKGFDGEYFLLSIRSGMFLGLGARYDLKEEMICPMGRISYFNYKRFPYTVDYSFQLYNYKNYTADNSVILHGIGLGSAYILSRKWTLDYGLGFMWSFDKYITKYNEVVNPNTGYHDIEIKQAPYLGLYTRAGITFSYFLSLYWCHGFAIDYPYAPINALYLVLTYPLPFSTK